MTTTKVTNRSLALHSNYAIYRNSAPWDNVSNVGATKVLNLSGSVTYGDNIRDWKQRIAAGTSATTTLLGTSTLTVINVGGTIQTYSSIDPNHVRWIFSGDIFTNSPTAWTFQVANAQSVDSVADSRAASKFLKHFIEERNTWRGGNFLAEIRETIHALRHPVKSIYQHTWDFAGKVKKLGRVHQSKKEYSKHLADAWLAYQFGIKPLISDANDAGAALGQLKGDPDARDHRTISGYGRNSASSKIGPVVVTPPPTTSSQFCSFYVYVNQNNAVRYHGALSADLADRTNYLDEIGLSYGDIVPAFWEAIPWSFAIDYFTNVGEMIDSCRLWFTDCSWVNRTVRNSVAQTARDVYYTPTSSVKSYVLGSPKLYMLARYVNRTPSSVPQVRFHWKMPGIASMKWLNIAALSKQCFSSAPTAPLSGLPYSGKSELEKFTEEARKRFDFKRRR
jgi:hypothetical protein